MVGWLLRHLEIYEGPMRLKLRRSGSSGFLAKNRDDKNTEINQGFMRRLALCVLFFRKMPTSAVSTFLTIDRFLLLISPCTCIRSQRAANSKGPFASSIITVYLRFSPGLLLPRGSMGTFWLMSLFLLLLLGFLQNYYTLRYEMQLSILVIAQVANCARKYLTTPLFIINIWEHRFTAENVTEI